MGTRTYIVDGMTCSHCVASVTEEVERLDGVTEVDIDLASGAVAITSTTDLDHAAVTAAVEEAGYEIRS